MNLVFATGNEHKVSEVREKLPGGFTIQSLKDIGYLDDIAETGSTLKENALIKARTVSSILGIDCFAEDSGLEVIALDGAPGVHTARYAGPRKNALDNNLFLLNNLAGQNDRSAQFRAVIALIIKGKEYVFEGIVEGSIAHTIQGEGGFGYDPIFIPNQYDQSFAVLPASVKSTISHRARAVDQLIHFLRDTSL